MDMFGLGSNVKKFEKNFLHTKETGVTIEDFERDALKNTVYAYYMAQDVTERVFAEYQQKAVDLAGTPEGDEATMAAGFLVGINDAIHNPEYEFSILTDMKRKQLQGWGFLIGDEDGSLTGAVEFLNEYARARKFGPQEILRKFPREEFEQAMAELEKAHAE